MKDIKQFIEKKGIKQLMICKELGIDPGSLSKYLNHWAKLPKKHHSKLAEFLGLSVEEILTNELKGN